MRIGLGYDLHRLVEERPLVLGGIEIDHDRGLLGHSDGDVLLHAIIDALLGALSLGDIGQKFPDTDARYKGISSLELLTKVAGTIRELAGVVNLDATIVCQEPKLAPHIQRMRKKIAGTLNIPEEMISLKAKTNEGLGPEGAGDAISAYAVVLLAPR